MNIPHSKSSYNLSRQFFIHFNKYIVYLIFATLGIIDSNLTMYGKSGENESDRLRYLIRSHTICFQRYLIQH